MLRRALCGKPPRSARWERSPPHRVRVSDIHRRPIHARAHLARQRRHPLRDGSGSHDRGSARRHHQGDELRHLRLGPPPLRRLHARHEARRHHGPRVHGRGDGGRRGQQEAEGRRPGRRPLHHLLRRLRAMPARQLVGLRELQPQRQDRRRRLRPHHGGSLRLHPHHRRLFRRSGGIRPRALCRRRTRQDPGRPHRRAGALPRRHPAHRLAGGRPGGIEEGDTVAVWGCGPVGQFAILAAKLLGAAQVVAIDRVPERLAMAERTGAIRSISRRRASSCASTTSRAGAAPTAASTRSASRPTPPARSTA